MKTKVFTHLLIIPLLIFSTKTHSQVGINSTGVAPAANAMLDIASSNKGLLIPRVTSANRTALSGEGMVVFDTDTKTFWFHNGTAWVNNWINSGTNISSGNTGNVGIGQPSPTAKLDINGSLKYTNGNQSNGRVLTSDPSGNANWQPLPTASGYPLNIPEVVNWRAVYSPGGSYALSDLVSSTTPNLYFYSLTAGNIGHTPESSPTFWQAVEVEQLNLIHKTMPLPSNIGGGAFSNIISFQIPSLGFAGGRIYYTMRARDAGSQYNVETGVINYLFRQTDTNGGRAADDTFTSGTMSTVTSLTSFGSPSQPGLNIGARPVFSNPAPVSGFDLYYRVVNNSANNVAGVITKTIIRIEP